MNGISSDEYHKDKLNRGDVQQRWHDNKLDVIVATVAFGLGIDKEDVRFIIHDTTPDSFQRYLQETGRAGRDG